MPRYPTPTLLSLAAAALLFAAGTAQAQEAILTGSVTTDGQFGALITVSALDSEGGFVRSTEAAQDGSYRLSVPAGVYTVVVTAFGFEEIRLEGVTLRTGTPTVRNFSLVVEPFSIQAISVTAGRRPQKALETAASISVVDQDDISSRHAVSPLDHVAGVPGVDVATQGIQAQQVSTRGFNGIFGQNLMLLTDYRHASAPSLRVNLSQTLVPIPEDVERVEVLRGPASALYGASAADGVVHIITKSPFDSEGTAVDLVAGGQSLFQGMMRHATVVNDNLAVRLSGQYFRADEWPVTPQPTELQPRDLVQERAAGELRVDGRFGETEMILNLGRFHGYRYVEQTEIGASQAKNWQIHHAQLRVTNGRFFAQGYVNWNDAGDTRPLQTLAEVVDDSRLWVGQIQHGLDVGDRASLTYGLDYQFTDTRTGGTISGRNEDDDGIHEVGAYTQAEVVLTDQLRMVGAVRLDDHSRLTDPVWSPQIGLILEPEVGHAFRVTYNRAFTPPVPTQLVLDLPAGSFDPLPFDLVARGVPLTGYDWGQNCGGTYCMRSPFGTGDASTIDASAYWPVVVGIMQAGGIDLSAIPAPASGDVGTALRVLNLSTGAFDGHPSTFNRIDPLRPTLSNTFEVGYKGVFSSRVALGIDVYHTRRKDFTGALSVVTPNAFLDTGDLATYLANYMPAEQAQGLAAAIGGVNGDPALPGIPLGTVVPDDPLAGTDILLTYQNFGEIDLWGTDISVEAVLNEFLTWSGTYSHISDNYFGTDELAQPFTLNAPRHKGFTSLDYRDRNSGRWGSLRARAIGSFRQIQGAWQGEVDGFVTLDAEIGAPIPGTNGLSLSLALRNLTGKEHREFVGAPMLGRLFLVKAQYRH